MTSPLGKSLHIARPSTSKTGTGIATATRHWLGTLSEFLNALGSIWIFGLMCMMLADMGSRSLFNRPLAGVAEMAGLSIVGIVYLQLPSAVRSGRMTRADFLFDWFMRTSPRCAKALSGVYHLLGSTTMGILAYICLRPLLSAWTDSETMGTAGVFLVQTWPFRGILVLGSTLAAVCYLALAWRDFVAALHRSKA